MSVKVSQPCGNQDQKQKKPVDQTVILQRVTEFRSLQEGFLRNVFFSEEQLLITLCKIATTDFHQPLPFHPGLIFPDTFLHLTRYVVEFLGSSKYNTQPLSSHI